VGECTESPHGRGDNGEECPTHLAEHGAHYPVNLEAMPSECEVIDAPAAATANEAALEASTVSLAAAKPATTAPATPPANEDKTVPRSLRSWLLISALRGRAAERTVQTAYARKARATTVLASSLALIDGSFVEVGLPSIAVSLSWLARGYLLPLSALLEGPTISACAVGSWVVMGRS